MWAHLPVPYTVIGVTEKWDMNYFLVWILVQWQTDGRTESDAYEPNVQKHRCAKKFYEIKLE